MNDRPEWFDKLITENMGAAYAVALKYGADFEADELVAEAVISAITHWRVYDAERAFGPWFGWRVRSVISKRRSKARTAKRSGIHISYDRSSRRELDRRQEERVAEFGARTEPTQEQQTELALLDRNLGCLSPRSADVLRRRFLGETLGEVGEAIGVTKERVRRIELKATRALAKRINSTPAAKAYGAELRGAA